MKYIKGVIREFSSIRWLPFSRALALAFLIIVFAILCGFLIGIFDSTVALLLKAII